MGIADPREVDGLLGVLQFHGGQAPVHFGVATSGTSVHRWRHATGAAHHLIDPRTWRPAVTDVVQATVVAASAREAEALAKTAVIVGAERAFALVDRPGVLGALVLTEHGELRATPEMLRWLA
jgi:thiamine biosynthesis lipoprotein